MADVGNARFRPTGQDDLAPSGAAARVRANLEAIGLVRVLEQQRRPATVDEQRVLARWSGWGAVPAVFDEREMVDGRPGPGAAYRETRAQLRRLLSVDEYDSARANTINAHFTDAGLVAAIWGGLGALGFTGGRVLEPGCGSGNFIGLAPEGTDMVGVELDPTTVAITSALYPHATVLGENFAATALPEASFDAVIGNVPFGKVQLRDTRYNPGRHLPIHTHFIHKALHLVAPGGLVALVASRFTLDGVQDTAVRARERMAAMADLVAAVRLPDTAHRRAAGTTVVTDLVILRRREPDRTPEGIAWVDAPVRRIDGEDIAINEYFDAHPEMVLGALAASGHRAGELRVRGVVGAAAGLTHALDGVAVQARERGLLMAPAVEQAGARPVEPGPARAQGRPERVEGFIAVGDDGTFTQVQDGVVHPYAPPRMSETEAAELRTLCGLRDTTLALLEAESRDDEPEMDRLRARLNDDYDRYLQRYGPINRVNIYPTIRDTPQGRALRDRLIADGHARIAGGTVTVLGEATEAAALRERLLNEGLATEATDGGLRMRQSRAGRAEGDRLVADGLVDVHGGTLKLAEHGRTIASDADPAAVSTTRRRPRQGGFRSDPFAVRAQGLERYSAQTRTATKTDIFRQSVMPARSVPRSADTPADALAMCMDQHAQVRVDVIAGLLGVDESTARDRLGELVFYDPDQDRLVPAAEYLSGDVRAKLGLATVAAIDDPTLRVNVEALTDVIPEDLGPAEIEVRLGSVIVDVDHVQRFLRETLEDDTVQVVLEADGRWKVHGGGTGGVLAASTWGTDRAPATDLAEDLLNQRTIKIYTRVDKDTTVFDAEATEAACDKAEDLNERFGAWVWEDLDRAETITRRYNDTFNAIVLRNYDDVELSLPGLNRNIRLGWWQKAAVARMIAEPAVGLFHEMGAGKTLEQIIGMMELRRLGLINKPVMCIKNHMLDQVRDEFMWAYPSARVLCADSDELAGEGKRRFIARCMSENPDAVILTRGAFAGINLSPEGHRAYIDYAVDLFRAYQNEASVKDQQTSLMDFHQKIEAIIEGDPDDEDDTDEAGKKRRRRAGIDKDPALTWEHAGFDYIVVDESQDFNNLWTPSNVEGMDIGFVHRAVDLEMKLLSTRQRFGQRVATFATGIPVTNRIVQFYVMQRYLRPDRLKTAGFYSADAWLATFAAQETRLELKGDNTYGPVTRTSELINIPEMLLDLHQVGDFKTADDIDLARPAIVGGKPEVVVVPAASELQDYQRELTHRYATARRNHGKKGEDTVVAVIGDGFRAGQDLRLVSTPRHGPVPAMTDEPQKVDALAADLLREWREHRGDVYLDADGEPDTVHGSMFLVFCNEGVPSPEWNLYDELRELLVQGGVPRGSIRFVHETGSDRRKKSELVAACNDGHVAVLIGSTEKMGVGTNVQRRVAGIYKMHPHWRPDYDDQENARGRRPGNQNSQIFIKKFITEGSFDVIRAQRCEIKSAFQSVYRRRDPTVRTFKVPDDDTVGYAEVAALGAGDLRLIEKAALDAELKKLLRARRSHAREQNGLKMAVRRAEQGIRHAEGAIRGIDQALPRRVPTAGEDFTMTIDGVRHAKRADAAAHLRTLLLKHWDATIPGSPRIVDIGGLGGFTVQADLDRDRRPNTVRLSLRNVYAGDIFFPHSKIPTGHGLITRLENRLTDLDRHRQELTDRIPAYHQEIERARSRIGVPFAQEEQLRQTRARRDELEKAIIEGTPLTDGPASSQNTTEDLIDRAVTGILTEHEQRSDPAPAVSPPEPTASKDTPSEREPTDAVFDAPTQRRPDSVTEEVDHSDRPNQITSADSTRRPEGSSDDADKSLVEAPRAREETSESIEEERGWGIARRGQDESKPAARPTPPPDQDPFVAPTVTDEPDTGYVRTDGDFGADIAAPPFSPANDPDPEIAVDDGGTMADRTSLVTESATGPWSARITIDDTPPRPTVSGTRYEDERLRAALRDNGFRWRKPRGLWEYTGPAVARDAAVAAIVDVVAELDRAEGGRPSFPPTAQQQAIIDACTSGQDVAVQALAGTGKTSTLRMVAEAMPDKRIVYIAFNRSIAKEAQAAFGRNVTAATAHAFALRALRSGAYADKTAHVGKGARHPGEVAEMLGLSPIDYFDPDGRPAILAPSVQAQLAMAVVRTFRESADTEITVRHLPEALTLYPGDRIADAVLSTARRAWEDIADPNNAALLAREKPGAICFDHDDYLKLWALSRPRLDTDVIFFDEAQDINDVLRGLVQDQPMQTIVVGDTYQSIYGFRGAKDALADWPADVTLPLTRSWRFGPAVAAIGDDFLQLLGAPYELEGDPASESIIDHVDDPDAILCRTNVGAVSEVFTAFDAGKRVALVGGGSAISDLAHAARDLKAGRGTKHPELSRFTAWHEVEKAAEDERALQTFVRLIERHSPDELLRMVAELVHEDATGTDAPDVVISTAHKAKGREWDDVRIAGDFYSPTYDQADQITALPPAEELRLSYVAVTRARNRLDPGSLQWVEDAVGVGLAVDAHTDLRRENTVETSPTPDQALPLGSAAETEPRTSTGGAEEPPGTAPETLFVPSVSVGRGAQMELFGEAAQPDPDTRNAPSPRAGRPRPRRDAERAGETVKSTGNASTTDPPGIPPPPGQEPVEPAQESTSTGVSETTASPPVLVSPVDAGGGPAEPEATETDGRAQAPAIPEPPETAPGRLVAFRRPAGSAPQEETTTEPTDVRLDRLFTGMLDALQAQAAAPEETDEQEDGQEPAADPRPGGRYEFADINARFAALRRELGLGGPSPQADPDPDPAAVDEDDNGSVWESTPVADALAEARQADQGFDPDPDRPASWYRDTPEWRRITGVNRALGDLLAAMKKAAIGYADEFDADVRKRGFVRVIAARTARRIADVSGSLAGRIEHAGHRDTRIWKAIWRLHRAAADHADRLMGYLPPGRTMQRVTDLRKNLTELWNRRNDPASTVQRSIADTDGPGTTDTTGSGIEILDRAFAEAADHADGLPDVHRWQRLHDLWTQVRPVLSRAHQAVLNFDADAQTHGLFRAIWSRTCEIVSHNAQNLIDRMNAGGTGDTLAYNALRVLRHGAEDCLARHRGYLDPGKHTPLGTYDIPVPEGPAPADDAPASPSAPERTEQDKTMTAALVAAKGLPTDPLRRLNTMPKATDPQTTGPETTTRTETRSVPSGPTVER